VRIFSFSVLVGMLALVTARPVCAAPDQNQTPPPPKPPDQGQGQSGQGQGQSGQGQGGLGLWLGRPQTNRPYRGLFGGGVGETEHLLTLGLNAGGGYDSSVFVDHRQDPTEPIVFTRTTSGFGAGSANLNYSFSKEPVSLWASGGAGLAYYPRLLDPFVHRYFVEGGGSWKTSTNTGVAGSYSLLFRPIQHLLSVPVGALDPNLDPALGPGNPFDTTLGGPSETYRNENGQASFSYQASKRVQLSFGGGGWRVVAPDRRYNSSMIDLSARATIGVAKDLGVYTGYRFSTQRAASELDLAPFRSNSIDVGLHFAKALSLTRHTYLSFGTGTSAVSDGNDTQYSVTGHVNLMRELGRTWNASANYSRDAQFVQTFLQPVFSDTVSGNVSGLFSRRVRFDSAVHLSYGKVGVRGPSNGYNAFHATAGIGIAINRYLSGGARYVYSRYSFGDQVVVPLDLLYATDRHGVSVNLSSWLPLYTRTRRP
jgi:hypothetical protein